MPQRLRVLVLAAAAALALVAAGAGAGSRHAAPMRVAIDIYPRQGGELVLPENIAVRAGGEVTVTLRNHTKEFHTFTIRALHVSVIVRPFRTETATFVAPYGVYSWTCLFCGTPQHPHDGPMGGKVYAIVNT